jgi:multidrug resistance efflux pump
VQDIEALQRQVEELQAANDKLDKSKKKLQAELEDSNIDLEAQRAKVLELEKKQRNFDKVLAEEKVMRRVRCAEHLMLVYCVVCEMHVRFYWLTGTAVVSVLGDDFVKLFVYQ